MSSISLPNGSGSLWVPGMGDVPLHMRQSMKAIEEYDEDLSLARNDQTGNWCIFISRGENASPFPVFDLGRELPGPDQIKEALYRGDVRRRGHEILRDVERNNARRRAELAHATDEAAGDAAETIEWAMRKLDATSHKKVYLNERVKK